MPVNLHKLASSAIATVHPYERITLYMAQGTDNVSGEIVQIYMEPQEVMAQVQNYERQTVGAQLELDAEVSKRVYLNALDTAVPSSLYRQEERGGDIVQMEDSSYWQATAMPDDFRLSGWVCLKCVRLTIDPDFSASPWWPLPPEPEEAAPDDLENGSDQ